MNCKQKNITPDTNNVLELIKKVSELAKRGVEGEKNNAIEKLNKLCLKYGVEVEDIEGMSYKVRTFKYSNSESKMLLSHCIWDVKSDVEIQCDSTLRTLFSSLNAVEYLEVIERYKYYWKLYQNEKKTFTTAFILKNKIGVKITDEPITINKNEVHKLGVMLDLVNEKPFEKNKNLKELN